jgi:hypothetical protein
MKVELHIERVIVDETVVSRADGPTLQHAIENEIHRLILEGATGPAPADAAVGHAQGPEIHVGVEDPDSVGRQVGRSVYEGVGLGRPEAR